MEDHKLNHVDNNLINISFSAYFVVVTRFYNIWSYINITTKFWNIYNISLNLAINIFQNKATKWGYEGYGYESEVMNVQTFQCLQMSRCMVFSCIFCCCFNMSTKTGLYCGVMWVRIPAKAETFRRVYSVISIFN